MMLPVILMFALSSQVVAPQGGQPAAAEPQANAPQDAPPADGLSQPAAPAVDERDLGTDDRDSRKRGRGDNTDEADDAEGLEDAELQKGPGAAVTGLAAGAAAAGSIVGAAIVGFPLWYVVGICTLGCGPPLILGALGGTVGAIVTNLVGKRRVPWLPIAGAGAAALLGLTVIYAVVTNVLLAPALIISFASTASGDSSLAAVGTVVYALGVVGTGLCALIMIAGTLGVVAALVGALAANLGRQMTPGESGVKPDLVSVPKPRLEQDDDDEDAEEEDQPRSKKKSKVKRAEEDDEGDEAEEEKPKPRKKKAKKARRDEDDEE